MIKYSTVILLAISCIGFAAADWLFAQACTSSHVNQPGYAENGDCVFKDGVWNSISCKGSEAVLLHCTDPACTKCKEYSKRRLNRCDEGVDQYYQCFTEEPPFGKLMGGPYAYMADFDSSCTSAATYISVWPIGCRADLYDFQSTSARCDQHYFYLTSWQRNNCTGESSTLLYTRATCTPDNRYIECIGTD